ncbi:tripartite tricarboxylate transporter permease [Pelagibacterium lacus]|uniref:C4-dicarboxylate ABC transporter permease n=1 Tax=Pelagibacterium lacus TaxID=2282655 RepID=A0A369WDF7_9HYPH|nr:tripartite tricarboxylate transporter permease [Pelagibacterium lacus]RDE10151.1 C4-dicarboxylate ABC transporter permease [Pelagibacterium lacus]
METLIAAAQLVLEPYTLMVILACALFGLFIGAVPGLSATMATAMLVPITFYMDPVPAVGAIVTMSAMAIFASDIPAALVRIPGTAASAAYVDDLHQLTLKGKPGIALGLCVVTSAIGGVFGTAVLMIAAPQLAEVSLNFTSFEYFWLALLGLSAAVMLGSGTLVKSVMALCLGLLVASVGLDTSSGYPRFTYGQQDFLSGVPFIPALIGFFAVPEVIRAIVHRDNTVSARSISKVSELFEGMGKILWKFRFNVARGSVVGTLVGILPGAGSDIASWISYAISKRFSKHPERYGKGYEEGLVDSGAANNSALSGAYVPAMVFGIPGDSITAIVIGVLYVKGLNPGPMVFINNAVEVNAIFLVFMLANLLMVPLGILAILMAAPVLRVSKTALAPLILCFAIVGSFSIELSTTAITVMMVVGVFAYLMEENGIPVAPAVLGLVMGTLVERNLITSLIKADNNPLAFFERPIAGGLGVVTLALWFTPLLVALYRRYRRPRVAA